MKRVLFSILLSGYSLIGAAQNYAVTNAILYHKDGEILKAKQEIDGASQHEKTKANAKTWYYKGLIYQDIAMNPKAEIKAVAPEALQISYEAYNKALELDASGKGEYSKMSSAKLQEIWGLFINKGLTEYEASNYKQAIASFEVAQSIKPADTLAYINAIYAAEQIQDMDVIKNSVQKLNGINYKSPVVYYYQIIIENEIEKSPEKALATVKKGLADFPNHKTLLELQKNLYLQTGKDSEAVASIEYLVKNNPNDINLLNQLAILYGKNDTDKALETYSKVLSLDPNDLIANFNTSVIYYNSGKEKNQKLGSLSVGAYQKEGKALEAEINDLFKKSLDHAQRALSKAEDPGDKQQLDVLIKELTKIIKQ
jgi:tetratricopeptide (TPR) repeat protein